MRVSYLIFLLLLMVSACKSQKNNSVASGQESSTTLTMVMSDNYGGTSVEELQVIRSKKELDNFFVQINKARKPGLKPPVVDFTKDLVIVYCPGKTVKQGLPKLSVMEAAEQGMIILKDMAEVSDSSENTAILMPFGLYIMPVTDSEISLRK